MTIAVKNPTPGDVYHFYELVNGQHVSLGSNSTGELQIPQANISKGTHNYVVRVIRGGKESTLDSNQVTYRKKRR